MKNAPPLPSVSTRFRCRWNLFALLLLTISLTLFSFSSTQAQPTNQLFANFEDLAVGTSGTSITDSGITFSNLSSDTNTPGVPFYVDSTTDTNYGFSLPNYLTFGGSGFGSFSSANINFSGTATNASIVVGGQGDATQTNGLTLVALNGTNVVAMNTTYVFTTNSFEDVTATLSVSWTSGFTSLELLVTGTDNFGSLFFGLDNVQINGALLVPEPSTKGLILASLPIAALLYWRLRRRKNHHQTELLET